MVETLLTEEGLEKIKEELDSLKSVKRIEVAARIKQAIEYGDLSENSEYEDAKNEQAFVEGRISELEQKINTAKIIKKDKEATKVVKVGSTVLLKDLKYGDEFKYTIVGSAEADPRESRISNESPVGKAILGSKAGDTVDVEVPNGDKFQYKVISLK